MYLGFSFSPFQEAVRLLLSRRHILRADDPNADYHYSGSVRWTAKERLSFRQAYRTKGKFFIDIQKEVSHFDDLITCTLATSTETFVLEALFSVKIRQIVRMIGLEIGLECTYISQQNYS